MMLLPRLNRHFIVFYHSENFIRKFTEAIDIEKKIVRCIRLSDTNFHYTLASGDTISVFEEPYQACCGQRADIVFIEDGISWEVMWEIALPAATVGEKSVWVWRNEKWFRFEELYNKRNSIEEAEKWLTSLTEDCKYNYDDECEFGGWCRYSSQTQKECKCYEN